MTDRPLTWQELCPKGKVIAIRQAMAAIPKASKGDIAEYLSKLLDCRVTPNMVISRCRDNKITLQGISKSGIHRTARAPRVKKPKPKPVVFLPQPEGGVLFIESKANQCRWITTPDKTPIEDVKICGATAIGSWCPYHLSIVSQPREKSSVRVNYRI